MSYTEQIVQPLFDTLSRTAGLPKFQLAGHVPNLAFWIAEVRHAIGVIEGYDQRYGAIVAAQSQFDLNHPAEAQARQHHEYTYHGLRVAVSPALAERLKQKLIRASEKLIERCLNDGLIDDDAADDLRSALGRSTPAA